MPYALTPRPYVGSSFLICAAILGGCAASSTPAAPLDDAVATRAAAVQAAPTSETPPKRSAASAEVSLGVTDTGIFSDLDDKVQIRFPADAEPSQVRAVIDREHSMVVAYVADWPVKAYPVTGEDKYPSIVQRAGAELDELSVGELSVDLRPGDRAELAPYLSAGDLSELAAGAEPAPGDADGDGIPDPLDLLIGAHKTVLNGADYGAGYIRMDYPNGDVPREVGVCTDVIVRAVRNAGTDIQSALQKDIKRSKRSYPMVKKRNSNIDHRRVKTLLPYFKRHWEQRSAKLDDADDPLMPGDIVFMDTFPSKSGPDHIGIISNRVADSGRPLVINNWTNGTKTAEMDLLDWVPVTHRFRYRVH